MKNYKPNKIILFDFDGVVCNKKELFSQKFSREYNIPIEKINKFFETEFSPCLTGKADLKSIIIPYITEWGIAYTVDEFLNYWFKSEHFLDKDLLKYIQKLRMSGTQCHLVSNQERHRGCYILKQMGMEQHFDSCLFSYQARSKKPDEAFWQRFFETISLRSIKENIVVWDDDENNVQGARDYGYSSYLYTNFSSFKEKMNEIL